ncbi:epimerase [Nocardioides sp. JQ2195]|uniref:NAD-dependent epimerase/dehydratase family protein n=1 Tax=Nocardioides sp. JQ2195 TaxID=2592334 RepID=UPI00143E72ED|nr:NAD-dependent epimerase/dehydratase family protein [Nocardioides sp. JQ2195]QIX25321.1 epimerase [Nocardioides sp. JQ2195]
MKLLVLGGTVFLSRAVAAEAVARGHEVTCACRGASGPVPEGARHVVLDRSAPDWGPLDVDADAVVDVARHPGRVRDAVARFPDAHWVFVSTVSVYSDDSVPGGTPDTVPVHDPITTDEDLAENPSAYGPMKVACEQVVLDGTRSPTIVRAGLIVGPGDPSGRFTYWPDRVADGGEVLAPGSPDDPVQLIDVRDLAAWIVTCAERRTGGVLDGTGRATSRREFLDEVARGVGVQPRWTWVSQERLAEEGVAPWSGPRSLPLWVPLPEYAGHMSRDVDASYAAGLVTRPLADTARDTLAWLRATPGATRTGLTQADEASLLSGRTEPGTPRGGSGAGHHG